MANIINQNGQVKLGVRSTSAYPTDADAQAFITAAAITGATQATAINTLVAQLKIAGIWSKMKALYPFVGGTAAQHRFNLKSPGTTNADFYLAFNGGGTHGPNGYQPNGNSYANTYLIPSTSLLQNSTHISYYSRTNTAGSGIDFGVYQTSPQSNLYAYIKYTDGKSYFRVNRSSGAAESSLLITSSSIFFMINRTDVSNESVFVNNTKTSFGRVSTGLSTNPIPFGVLSNNGTYVSYSNRECAFASIGDGLTDAEATAFYTAVQAYQTTLGRNV